MPPPAARTNGQPPKPAAVRTFNRSHGIVAHTGKAIVIYGTGGIGKSTLAAEAPNPLFIDLEHGSYAIDTARIDDITSWSDLRGFVQSGDIGGADTLIVDTGAAAEDMCRRHIVETVKTDKGHSVTSIESYGWGKGYTFLFEEWKRFLADLDRHIRDGRNVVIICHDRTGKVPNPAGDDYIRYEPRLFNTDKVSLMYPTKEWADEVWFVGYDVVAKDGKARGSGTRTIHVTEDASHMAKTRTLSPDPIIFERGAGTVWNLLSRKADGEIPL
jgi:hypothetical protein